MMHSVHVRNFQKLTLKKHSFSYKGVEVIKHTTCVEMHVLSKLIMINVFQIVIFYVTSMYNP